MERSLLILDLIQRGHYTISRQHIEHQRPWRGITGPHVKQALLTGMLMRCEQNHAILRGNDIDGRILELPVRPVSAAFRLCETWADADSVHVMTAYIPDGHTNEMIRRLIYKLRMIFLGDQQ